MQGTCVFMKLFYEQIKWWWSHVDKAAECYWLRTVSVLWTLQTCVVCWLSWSRHSDGNNVERCRRHGCRTVINRWVHLQWISNTLPCLLDKCQSLPTSITEYTSVIQHIHMCSAVDPNSSGWSAIYHCWFVGVEFLHLVDCYAHFGHLSSLWHLLSCLCTPPVNFLTYLLKYKLPCLFWTIVYSVCSNTVMPWRESCLNCLEIWKLTVVFWGWCSGAKIVVWTSYLTRCWCSSLNMMFVQLAK